MPANDDSVDTLRKQLDEVLTERDILVEMDESARSIHNALVRNIESLCEQVASLTEERRLAVSALGEERDRMRAERDEARRRLCLEWTEHGPVRLSKEQIAMRYGWDCFKEDGK